MSRQQTLLESSNRITDVDIAERMERSFLDYSMSVIVGRALPDVRDGLKPVQRRILYAMWEAGLRPGSPPRKCSSVIGDVMKKYHPHGDTSIYETLVRLAQDFTTRELLIDGRGNFGSVDGDSAAAHRYTEALLSPVAMALLEGINENTVNFVDNYDGYEHEPLVLPARLPNLLVNGATGIAVGMATNIPPHNLGEVIDGCLTLLEEPEADLDALMRTIPAPDFPTGARIVAGDGIRSAYETGRGAITMEAIATTETRSGGMPRIVVTEIPYQVNKASMLEKIAGLVKDRKLDEIRDLRDESSRDGMRIVIELKRGEDPAAVLRKLYDKTDLRTNFNVNLVALVDGTPRTIGLRDCLVHYLAHQREVLTRRTQHRRDRAAERAHVLEGLLIALDHLDEVIALIRAAESAEVARGQLMERYALSEIQATAILDMQLRRLAQLERSKIAGEHRELVVLIADLDEILANPERRDALLAEELVALREEHANPRRSRLSSGAADELTEDDDLPMLDAQQVTVYVTRGGWLKAVPQRPTSAPHGQPRDPVAAVLRATTDDTVLLIDAYGGGYRVDLADLPVTTMRQRGTALGQLLGDPSVATIVGAVVLDTVTDTIATVSAQGLVKRSERSEYLGRTRAMIAAGVRDDDELVAVLRCSEGDEIMVAHSGGLVIRFSASEARPMGRSATGVSAITVPEGHQVVAASLVPRDVERVEVLTIAANGETKRAPLDEYPTQGRGGKGVRTGTEALAWCGVATDVHFASGGQARVYRVVEAAVARRSGRFTSGVDAPDVPVVAETGA